MTGPARTRPSLTLFHVLLLVVSIASAVVVYSALGAGSTIVRLIASVAGFVVAFVLTHVVIVYLISAWIIPRLKHDSYWHREVDCYMLSMFPKQWGSRSDGA